MSRLVDGTKRQPQARLDRSWLTSSEVVALGAPAFRLWVFLWSFANPDGSSAFPSARTLCRGLGYEPPSDDTWKSSAARRTVYRALAELEAAGLVVRHRNPQQSTTYELRAPESLLEAVSTAGDSVATANG